MDRVIIGCAYSHVQRGTVWDEIAMFYPVIPEQAGIQNVLSEFLF